LFNSSGILTIRAKNMFSDMNSIRRKTQQNNSYSPLVPANVVSTKVRISLAGGTYEEGVKPNTAQSVNTKLRHGYLEVEGEEEGPR
jgi:hypothetical protein